jgi:hypothetical protein
VARVASQERGLFRDILTSSFVFIYILALFRRFCSADRRVCGPRPVPAIMEKPQTAEPAVCATGHFVLVLCFHKHSGFVPSILQLVRRGVETLGNHPPPSGLRPVACGRQWVSNSSTTICPPAHLPLFLHSSTSRLYLEAETTGRNCGRKQKRTFWHNLTGRA